MNIELPEIVADYFAAERAKDSRRLSQCFRDDAVVRDEGRVHEGVAAIEAWHRDANKTFRYIVEPLDASVDRPTVIVRTRVTGDFPGGNADLHCRFTLYNNQVASLEIAP